VTKAEVCPNEAESAHIGPPRGPCQRKCVPSGKDAKRGLPIRRVRLSSGRIPEVIWGMSGKIHRYPLLKLSSGREDVQR